MVMGMKIKYLAVFAVVGVLAGCSSPAQRMADCEAQGISKDTCYLTEQNRKDSINNAAQKAAYENARKAVEQKAQSAKKAGVKHWDGMELKMTQNGLVVDGKPAAASETTKEATTYQQGLYTFIVYKNGKIAVMDDKGVFKGYAK